MIKGSLILIIYLAPGGIYLKKYLLHQKDKMIYNIQGMVVIKT